MYLPSYLEISLYCTVQCTYPCTLDLLVCVDHSFYNRFFSCFAGFLKSVFTNVSQYFFCYFYSCCFVNFFLHFACFFFFGCILVFLCYSIDAVSLSFLLFDSLFWVFFFTNRSGISIFSCSACSFTLALSLSLFLFFLSPSLTLSLSLCPPVQGARPRTRRVARMCSQMGSNPLGCWSTSGFKSNCLIRAPSQPFCHGSVRGHKAKVKRWTIFLKK